MALLDRLRTANGEFVPWSALGADRAGLVGDAEVLSAFGFGLEIHPFHGVAYRGSAERLCPDQIEWDLGTTRIGRRVAVWNRVASTNDLAARAGSSRSNDGLAILAEEQTAGRGRRGRIWTAPPRSSILLSVLIFPDGPLGDPAWLTALGAVAVAEVVQETTGADARIKWPNDVRVDRRKLAGILVERSAGAVIGIGLNVREPEDGLPPDLAESATTLDRLAGARLDRSEVARSLLRRLDHWYGRGISDGPGTLNPAIATRSEHLHRFVRVETRNGVVLGRLDRIDLGLGLTISVEGGRLVPIDASEVRSIQPLVDPGSSC